MLCSREATGHNTTYLPKVSSHSTSSSIVRSKSSKEGLPSGFYRKSKKSSGFQILFQKWFLKLIQHSALERGTRCFGTGTCRRFQKGLIWPACTAAGLCSAICFCVTTQEPAWAPHCLLISSALYNLSNPHLLGTQFHFPEKRSHGLSAQSHQSPHTLGSLPLLAFAHAVLSPWPLPGQRPLPILVNALMRLIAHDWEPRLWSQMGLRFSVAGWPHPLRVSWCSTRSHHSTSKVIFEN